MRDVPPAKDEFRDQWHYDISKTIIPLIKVTQFERVRELDEATCIYNLKLAPLETPEALWNWLHELLNVEVSAWFASIGWPEGANYWRNVKYFTAVCYPGFVEKLKNLKEIENG